MNADLIASKAIMDQLMAELRDMVSDIGTDEAVELLKKWIVDAREHRGIEAGVKSAFAAVGLTQVILAVKEKEGEDAP